MDDIDHRFMTPPSLRVMNRTRTRSGDECFLWDLRLAQPNVASIPSAVVHSFEHLLSGYMMAASSDVQVVAPMGCQTGFYIATTGIGTYEQIEPLLRNALTAITRASEVPRANPMDCGWAENHSLVGAQRLAKWLLSRQAEWRYPSSAGLSG